MSRKARELAEAAADRALARMPVVNKAAGTREALVQAAMPAAKVAVKMGRVIKANDRSMTIFKSQSDITSRALEQTRQAVERMEMLYRNMSEMPSPAMSRRTDLMTKRVNEIHFPEALSENKSNGNHRPAENYGSPN